MLEREHILEVLREHAPELQAAGLTHLRLFGSVARNEAGGNSDVDLIADFDGTSQLTLVTLGSLEHRLGDLLGHKVELSSAEWMKAPVRERAVREAVLAF